MFSLTDDQVLNYLSGFERFVEICMAANGVEFSGVFPAQRNVGCHCREPGDYSSWNVEFFPVINLHEYRYVCINIDSTQLF